MRMKKNKIIQRTYDPEFRNQAIKLVIETGNSSVQVAKDLGIAAKTVQQWVWRYRKGEIVIDDLTLGDVQSQKPSELNSSQSKNSLALQLAEEQRKNRELQAKLSRVEMEKSILKKAMVYFVEVPK